MPEDFGPGVGDPFPRAIVISQGRLFLAMTHPCTALNNNSCTNFVDLRNSPHVKISHFLLSSTKAQPYIYQPYSRSHITAVDSASVNKHPKLSSGSRPFLYPATTEQMCRPVTSIYECGHIKNAWESCGGDDPAAEPERELMSQTGGCEMCSPSHTPTATIHGWDMCVLQVIVAANHSWRCCECARTNGPNSPSCKREYMFHPFGALLSYADRVCGHPICDDCLGIGT